MYSSNSALYNGYGAHALKARYQHNFVMSQLLVTGLIAISLVTSALWPRERVVSIPGERLRPDSIIVRLDPLLKIRRTQPTGGSQRPEQEVHRYIVPEIVANSEFVDTSIFPVEDLNGEYSTDSASVGTGEFDSIGSSATEYIPGPYEFVVCEIKPEIIETVMPDYPELAKKAGFEGKVIIKALLDTSGVVREVLIAKSSGLAMLDAAAEKAAWKCLYKPAIQSGRPIWVWVTYPVVFKLSE